MPHSPESLDHPTRTNFPVEGIEACPSAVAIGEQVVRTRMHKPSDSFDERYEANNYRYERVDLAEDYYVLEEVWDFPNQPA